MHSLEESLRVARAVLEQGGGKLSPATLAVALGLSLTSSSFVSRVASARHFGLIEDLEGLLVATPLAKRILRPTNPDQVKQGLAESFLNFGVFKQLMDRFRNSQLPERTLLENILLEYGVSDVSKKIAYDVFVESGKFSGQIVDTGKGLLCGIVTEEKPAPVSRSSTVLTAQPDRKIVELLVNVGSLRTTLQLHDSVPNEHAKEIKKISRDLLDRSLELATELNMPATKMSLKIAGERLNASGFVGAASYIPYIEDGINEDLKLKEPVKIG